MSKYYKYRRKTQYPDSRRAEFVRQMLDKERDAKFSFRLPSELKESLISEDSEQEKRIKWLEDSMITEIKEQDINLWAYQPEIDKTLAVFSV